MADRVIDVAQSGTAQNTFSPEWRESFLLYCRDETAASLNVSVIDRNIFSQDTVMGVAELPVTDIAAGQQTGAVSLPVPLYLARPRRWWELFARPRRTRTGTLFADFEVLSVVFEFV